MGGRFAWVTGANLVLFFVLCGATRYSGAQSRRRAVARYAICGRRGWRRTGFCRSVRPCVGGLSPNIHVGAYVTGLRLTCFELWACMRIGIDASNIRGGGGITHLVELLNAARPSNFGFERITVWGSRPRWSASQRDLGYIRFPIVSFDKSLIWRSISDGGYCQSWQRSPATFSCPGASWVRQARPIVTTLQNMLPFEPAERRRFGWSARCD